MPPCSVGMPPAVHAAALPCSSSCLAGLLGRLGRLGLVDFHLSVAEGRHPRAASSHRTALQLIRCITNVLPLQTRRADQQRALERLRADPELGQLQLIEAPLFDLEVRRAAETAVVGARRATEQNRVDPERQQPLLSWPVWAVGSVRRCSTVRRRIFYLTRRRPLLTSCCLHPLLLRRCAACQR